MGRKNVGDAGQISVYSIITFPFYFVDERDFFTSVGDTPFFEEFGGLEPGTLLSCTGYILLSEEVAFAN